MKIKTFRDKTSINSALIKIRRDNSRAPDLNYVFHAPAIVMFQLKGDVMQHLITFPTWQILFFCWCFSFATFEETISKVTQKEKKIMI